MSHYARVYYSFFFSSHIYAESMGVLSEAGL